ncbi:MAG TPA: TolC family outer membrane protein [Micropepsaceae bacterium]|jgi:TolC family type I secretion outer membrane protein|nr:TolC family outer membrane protein [Micropepsaceae bacterium]
MDRFRAALLFGAALAPLLVVCPFPASALSLREALVTAYATNPQIESARANLRATDEEVAKANAGWRPSLSLNGSEGFQNIITDQPVHGESDRNQLSGTASLTEPLFRGGRTVAEIRRAKALVRAGQAQLVNAEQTVLLDAATAYMDTVRDTANVEYRRSNVQVLQDQLDASNTQLNAGAITQTDVQQTQARLATARAGLSVAEGQLIASRAKFERVIGRPAETLEAMPALPPLPATMDEAVTQAVAMAPALITAQENSRAADYAIDQATAALLPQVSLSLQYQYAKNSSVIGLISPKVTQRDASIYLQVTVPLYQGGAEYAQVRQAKEQRSQSLANVTDADRQVRETAQSAWGNFTSARDSIASNELAVQANQGAVMGVLQEQRAGERSILDILNAQQELLSGEIGLANAQHDATVAAFQLLASTGQLTAKSLALDTPLYDPLKHYNRDASAWVGLDP